MFSRTKVSSHGISFGAFPTTRSAIRVWIFLLAIAFAHLFVGYKLGGRLGLFIGLLMATNLNILVFFFGEAQLLQRFRAKKIQGQDAWGLRDISKHYAKMAGLPAPTIYLIPSHHVLAFSLGHTWKNAAICLSQGLLERLSPEEVDAIVAHQVCHIRRLDTFSFGVMSSLANALVGLSTVLDRAWPVNWFRKGLPQRPFSQLLSPVSWLLIRFAVSDKNFYENDDLAASLLPNRKNLATALWKMECYSQTQPVQTIPCTHHLFVVNPEGLRESNWFYLTHPKLENRIRRLVGTYPL